MDTAAFVGQFLKLGIALALVAGTVKVVDRYDDRAAWLIVLIILLSIMVFQAHVSSSLDDALNALFSLAKPLGGGNLGKSPPPPPPPPYYQGGY